MRSGPPPDLLPRLPPLARLLTPGPRPRVLARLPPCRPTCCRALDCRVARESPRAVPPNLSAVPRSRYGAPPRCSGLCCHWLRPLPPFAGSVEARFPPPILLRLPFPILFRFPPLMFVLRLKLLLWLI